MYVSEKGDHATSAPEKEKTVFTMLPAKAMKEMPNTALSNSLKPPEYTCQPDP